MVGTDYSHTDIPANPGALESGITEDPLTDPALWAFDCLRRHWAGTGAYLAILPVPRCRAAGSHHVDRPHHLVRRNRAFRVGDRASNGMLQLLLCGAYLYLRRFC